MRVQFVSVCGIPRKRNSRRENEVRKAIRFRGGNRKVRIKMLLWSFSTNKDRFSPTESHRITSSQQQQRETVKAELLQLHFSPFLHDFRFRPERDFTLSVSPLLPSCQFPTERQRRRLKERWRGVETRGIQAERVPQRGRERGGEYKSG